MRNGLAAAAAWIAVFAADPGWAACPAGHARDCVNLDLVPQIAGQIVADEHLPSPRRPAHTAEPPTPYTGPTIGINDRVRRAAEIGYRWATD